MTSSVEFTEATWINEPQNHEVTADQVRIVTEPNTDFWQRSYYGFRNTNAPALLLNRADNFTFTVKAEYDYQGLFDQCGVIVYLDPENWFKASIEFENDQFSRLGSVVTNGGYSDWATTDIRLPLYMWYRLNRRGPDFLIESSVDGVTFQQMRIFHLMQLGKTTLEMGLADPPLEPENAVQFGVYACSPIESSFTARFSEMSITASTWRAHSAE